MSKVIPIVGLLLVVYAAIAFAFLPTRVENTIEIQGDPARVFDTITTAKYWTQWHPATLSVSGAIDHPMQLGEIIIERANIFGVPGTAEWQVIEFQRPSFLRLQANSLPFSRASIRYQFESRGDSVKFTRTLDYAFLGLGGPLDSFWIKPIMEKQSAEAIRNLKSLVERLELK